MHILQIHIDEAVTLILNTREFCGDEAGAVCDYCADESIRDWRKLYAIANFRANAIWNGYKKAANVNPKYIF